MIRIAYCDDSPMQQELLDEWIKVYTAKKGITIECTIFTDGATLIGHVKNNEPFDIYILDIILPDVRGTEVADSIKEIQEDAKIIFLTASAAFRGSVNAFGYLVKPVSPEQIYSILDEAIAELS